MSRRFDMESGFRFNSLSFLRRYYGIPAGRKLSWALVEESVGGKSEVRLGALVEGCPGLYIDVAMRRFFSVLETPVCTVQRRAFPARRLAGKDGCYLYVAENGMRAEFPRGYVRDVYFTSVFTPELVGSRLL